jgi:hypothetical protein
MRARMPIHLETISEDESEGEALSESAGQRTDRPTKMVTSEGDVRLPKRAGKFSVPSWLTTSDSFRVSASRYPRPLYLLAPFLGIPRLEEFIRRFLYDQLYPDSDVIGMDIELEECPTIDSHLHIKLFKSATVLYHAPSDVSGIAGMNREVIRATPSWQNGAPRHDCVLVELDPGVAGFAGMNVAQVQTFLSFKYRGVEYQAALVRWFEKYGDAPCDVTGLWRVRPDHDTRNRRMCSIIHIDTILRCAHLMPVFGSRFTPFFLHHTRTLDVFKLYYVNKYIDYHAFEVAF